MRKITLGHLEINHKGKTYVDDCLYSNRLSRGKYTRLLETEFARLHGSKHAIFLNSGTSALQVSLAVMKEYYGWNDGDEILVPAMTFIATSNVVIQNNLKPVFVDVHPHTYNMDPNNISQHITKKTRAIMPAHLFGLPADMLRICNIATQFGLKIIEDSCETMFASMNNISVGNLGDMACFSTYVAHLITGGIGGFITTSDSELARMARSSMAHGRDSIYLNIDQDDTKDETVLREMIERRFQFERIGYSYRATELEAAIALSELDRWGDNISRRRLNASYLTSKLIDIPELQLPYIPPFTTHSFMVYPIVLKHGDNREKFLMYLEQNGIETRYMLPLLSQPIYRTLFPGEELKHPIARWLTNQGFFIGIHQGLNISDMSYVSEIFHKYFKEV